MPCICIQPSPVTTATRWSGRRIARRSPPGSPSPSVRDWWPKYKSAARRTTNNGRRRRDAHQSTSTRHYAGRLFVRPRPQPRDERAPRPGAIFGVVQPRPALTLPPTTPAVRLSRRKRSPIVAGRSCIEIEERAAMPGRRGREWLWVVNSFHIDVDLNDEGLRPQCARATSNAWCPAR